MEPKKVSLLVWDDTNNFNLPNTQRQFGSGNIYKKVINFHSLSEFENNVINNSEINEEELLIFCCHINFADFSGYFDLRNSEILSKYLIREVIYLSSAGSGQVMSDLYHKFNEKEVVILYNELIDKIKLDKIKPFTKAELLGEKYNSDPSRFTTNNKLFDPSLFLNVDYAIVTALEADEMEKVLPMIERQGRLENTKHLIEYGFFKLNKNKKVVYASQLSTGMVDASILATEILIRFKPKFLIMTGVLGGKPEDVAIGDVIVATNVFTIDKGKIDKNGFRKEPQSSSTDSSYITLFKRQKKAIARFIQDADETRKSNIDIHFGSIACVNQVINVEGFFEEEINSIDRKAIALEMESYGISRACQIINNGMTTPIIVKSVMDNTQNKLDDAKTYAAWTSAKFAEYILVNNLI